MIQNMTPRFGKLTEAQTARVLQAAPGLAIPVARPQFGYPIVDSFATASAQEVPEKEQSLIEAIKISTYDVVFTIADRLWSGLPNYIPSEEVVDALVERLSENA